ncbi:hypothetical protein BCL69_10976 [Nitrosomonas communis]|uniref:Uncharacterized protein n=1 Tax=Nitrosomonas communis TaxID=44574 RepID=A0A5D3Y7B9_9PROT|nr:hypothetical protein BCL69_10976 [Nitrosomonas communis]
MLGHPVTSGVEVFKALIIDPDWEWEFIDCSYVKTH